MNTSKYSRYATPEAVKESSTAKLLDLWEATSADTVPHTMELSTVRGWLMDELERRDPDGFNRWLDCDVPDDYELRQYITENA